MSKSKKNSSTRKNNSTKNKKQRENKEINKEIIGILIISIGVLFLASMVSESTGSIGHFIKIKSMQLTGFGSKILPYIILTIGILFSINRLNLQENRKSISLIVIFLSFLIIFDIKVLPIENDISLIDRIKISIELSEEGLGGGLLGSFLSYIFLKLFGVIGSYIIITTVILISLLMFTNKSLIKILKIIYEKIIKLLMGSISSIKSFIYVNTEEETTKKKKVMSKNKENNTNIEKNVDAEDFEEKIKILDYTHLNDISNNKKNQEAASKMKEFTSEDNEVNELEVSEINVTNEANYENYRFPSLELLEKKRDNNESNEKKEILINARKLADTLKNFGINAKIVQVSRGPTITRYELQPAPGVKVSKIVSLSDDIALSLASSDIRIEAPIPGKSAVGIEVPNKDKSNVNLREVLESDDYSRIKTKLPLALGKDIAGKPIIANMEKMPHLLIAGATGSGKSVCINTIIISILFKAKPDEVKMLMIDPKVVELSIYNGIPHLLIPVVTNPKKAASALNWAVQEMTRRYKLFAKNGVRDIDNYNHKIEGKDNAEKLPKIVIIIDELADLMMVSPTEVEDLICRLAQMARAAGIHLIVATQRPSVDVITGTIKANIPSRISFSVSSQADSRTILDMGGAEKLLGKGDMLYYPVGMSKPLRVQGAFISESEVERIVEVLKSEFTAEYKNEIIDTIDNEANITNSDDSDELLSDAIDLVINEGQASISLLQRRLKIGYTRAARIIDAMEERGIIGGYEGSKPRKVLITKDEVEN